MNLGKILTTVGSSLLKNVVPGVGIVLDAVNAFLPDDKKLDNNATGNQAIEAINSLPPDQQASVLSKQLDVEIIKEQEFTKVITALGEVDKTGNSTRPEIAKMMATVTCFAIVVSISVWAVAVIGNKVATLGQLKDSWPLLVAILGTPTALLRAYFAMRSKEKKARYGMTQGNGSAGSAGIGGIAKMIGGIFK